jgi:preprotein translocase subunit SecA
MEGKKDEAGLSILRAYSGIPKNKALIKFLSEPGVTRLVAKNRKPIHAGAGTANA